MQVIIQARRMLETITPLKTDCGALCGRACCGGECGDVFLFPGEEYPHERVREAALEGGIVKIYDCGGKCERAERPFACRIFPLAPFIRRGEWDVRLDSRAWQMCPLMRSGKNGLSAEFLDSAREAVRLLASDPIQLEFLLRFAKFEARFRRLTL